MRSISEVFTESLLCVFAEELLSFRTAAPVVFEPIGASSRDGHSRDAKQQLVCLSLPPTPIDRILIDVERPGLEAHCRYRILRGYSHTVRREAEAIRNIEKSLG